MAGILFHSDANGFKRLYSSRSGDIYRQIAGENLVYEVVDFTGDSITCSYRNLCSFVGSMVGDALCCTVHDQGRLGSYD